VSDPLSVPPYSLTDLDKPGRITLAGAPEGYDALILTRLLRKLAKPMLHIARDDQRAERLADALGFFAPEIPILRFPAWDCLPYDRVSPRAEISSARMACLSALAGMREGGEQGPLLVIATVNSVVQRTPARDMVAQHAFSAAVGNSVDTDALLGFLAHNGYVRASTVREPGEFAVRGGIIDLFPPGADSPIRLDLFGDTLESIRPFDPETQRTTGQLRTISLVPASEVVLDQETIQRFRSGYVRAFGAVTDDDPLYENISQGMKHQGMEHWLPLFHDRLESLFDYLPGAVVTMDALGEDAVAQRLELIEDHYQARVDLPKTDKGGSFAAPAYKALAPKHLYLTKEDLTAHFDARPVRLLNPFQAPEEGGRVIDAGGRPGRSFAPERQQEGVNLFDALAQFVNSLLEKDRRILVACWTAGSRDRMATVLSDHGVDDVRIIERYSQLADLPRDAVALGVLGLEAGFEAHGGVVVAEQDVLGDRLIRKSRKRKADNFLTEASSLTPGDYVVHVEHGIGRYQGLKTLTVGEAPHDCLELIYHGGDKLYLPVENIELLTRFGSDDAAVQMDKLGGTAWQARKSKLKERILEMAAELIKIAAARMLKEGTRVQPPQGLYEEFCARFPYEETEDQEKAIHDVLEDLTSGKPMDRLICGDVGFGKTEVALRAAFISVMSGMQVAVVVPTTLLARQHAKTFQERFAGWPVQVRQLSRFVSSKDASETRKGLGDGQVDIVIGTHALLAKSVSFKNLGLLIIDEEQHFGVSHKERLKNLKADVHVLTLTATPIPRTLQLAMSGIRELSIIATPPVDRLAVRTFVGPFDPVVTREALLREKYRGGQSFYVCPRIKDLREVQEFLSETVPEVKHVTAHGQMASGELDDIMNAFYDGKYDVLISTTIVESGLDIPSANTLIVHRADMFGLAQLYQIRGRIGRSKQRAYAYLTVPPKKGITVNAEKRLKVLQSLDTLGAGFTLASHDMDIRGAGNLLGEEQSGHIKEVGVELYQSMLEEAVASLRSGEHAVDVSETWSPHINVGSAVLIPESYVADLDVRLALYRRLSDVESQEDIEGFAAELIDRFGPLPEEVKNLLKIVRIKSLCRTCRVEKVDAGPKGVTLGFRPEGFPNVEGLIEWVTTARTPMKLRPDGKLVYGRGGSEPDDRLRVTEQLLQNLASLVAQDAEAA